MIRNEKPGNTLTPAVSYIRMSSDKQSESPDQQRKQISEYAAENNYHLMDEYFDDAISGGRADREDFQRLIARFQQAIRDKEMPEASLLTELRYSHAAKQEFLSVQERSAGGHEIGVIEPTSSNQKNCEHTDQQPFLCAGHVWPLNSSSKK